MRGGNLFGWDWVGWVNCGLSELLLSVLQFYGIWMIKCDGGCGGVGVGESG